MVLTQFVSEELDKSSQLATIYTNLSKVFATINNIILISELMEKFGFSVKLEIKVIGSQNSEEGVAGAVLISLN